MIPEAREVDQAEKEDTNAFLEKSVKGFYKVPTFISEPQNNIRTLDIPARCLGELNHTMGTCLDGFLPDMVSEFLMPYLY